MTFARPVKLNYLATDLLALTPFEDAYELFGGGVASAEVRATSMFWDIWNLTCLGDPSEEAWAQRSYEDYGGRPNWSRDLVPRVPLHLYGMGYMYGFTETTGGRTTLREWPEWLRA